MKRNNIKYLYFETHEVTGYDIEDKSLEQINDL